MLLNSSAAEKVHESSSSVAELKSNEKHTPGTRDQARNTNIIQTPCSSDIELFKSHSSQAPWKITSAASVNKLKKVINEMDNTNFKYCSIVKTSFGCIP